MAGEIGFDFQALLNQAPSIFIQTLQNVFGNLSGPEIATILALVSAGLLLWRLSGWGQMALNIAAVICFVIILFILTGLINL